MTGSAPLDVHSKTRCNHSVHNHWPIQRMSLFRRAQTRGASERTRENMQRWYCGSTQGHSFILWSLPEIWNGSSVWYDSSRPTQVIMVVPCLKDGSCFPLEVFILFLQCQAKFSALTSTYRLYFGWVSNLGIMKLYLLVWEVSSI